MFRQCRSLLASGVELDVLRLLRRKARRMQPLAHGLVNQRHEVPFGQVEQLREVAKDEIDRLNRPDFPGGSNS